MRDVGDDGAARQAVAEHQRGGDPIRDFASDAAEVEREQDAAMAGRIGDGEGLDPKILRGAVRGAVARGVAGHPQRVGGGDFFAGGAGAPDGRGRGRMAAAGEQGRDAQRGEEGAREKETAERGVGEIHVSMINRRRVGPATAIFLSDGQAFLESHIHG